MKILVVGGTGSIGKFVVQKGVSEGHKVRALVRSESKARQLPREVEAVVGDLTRPETLSAAVDGIDAIVFTHGSDGAGKAASEAVDYGGVRNILAALGSRSVRIALMTAIGVTNRTSSYNRSTEAHDWKRRSERLVRASGLPYTIVRPGWFDYNAPDERKLVLLQGDKRQSGTPSDGAIARDQLAEVLLRSLSSDQAIRKTFELVCARGPAQDDLNALFATLASDPKDAMDAVADTANMPLDREPERVRQDLNQMKTRHSGMGS
jgi:uncharacterized protein YbjT (DUF2867 family)